MPILLLRPRSTQGAADRTVAVAAALEARAGSDGDSGLSELHRLDDPTGDLAGRGGPLLVCRLTTPLAAIGLLLALVRTEDWAAVVVVGPGTAGEPERLLEDEEVTAALRRAARASGRCAVVRAAQRVVGGRDRRRRATAEEVRVRSAAVESALQLLGVLERRRSLPQQEAGRRIEAGDSQREAAAALGISQQAVHDRLRHGLWQETRALAAAVADLLAELDSA